MKIKTKLTISFCIIIFVPILLIFLAVYGYCTAHVNEIRNDYGIKDADAYSLTNSVLLLNKYTNVDFEEMEKTAQENPQRMEDMEYLQGVNRSLQKKCSYLVLRRGEEVVYNGGTDNSSVIDSLPDSGSADPDSGVAVRIDSNGVLVKQIDFRFLSGEQGSAFIITETSQLAPEIRKLATELIVTIIGIIVLTAVLLLFWVYHCIMTPIKKLQTAAENIKEGNLDFTVDVSGEDELGELGVTFEQMRQRLN